MKPVTLFKLWVLVLFISPVSEVAAQSDIALHTRSGQLQELARSLKARDKEDRRQVLAATQRLGIPARRKLPNGNVLELQRIAPGIGPIFYITNNYDAADTIATDEIWPGGSAGLDLDGSGLTIGEWDGGAVFATHSDLLGRVTQVDGATAISAHSTHVAGTLIGAGAHPFYPQARGMAYAAHLDAYDWNSDTAEMALAAANGMLVSNHSYGIAAGWLYLGDVPPDTWWWIGGENPSIVEDANFGYYDSEAQLWDQIARDAPYYLIAKASGNDRWDTGPVPGQEYTIIDQNGYFLSTSTAPRNADCAPAGYDCLPGHSVAKNILTVGAVDDLTGGYAPLAGPSQVQMAGFSGWGPTDDGRIKPDVVGNGIWLVSTWPDDPGYAAALGTSMATPSVSGSLLLLQEHYESLNGSFMRAATLKAVAIHTADEAGSGDGPDYEFGWGLLNIKNAAGVITEDGSDHWIIEGTLSNGGMNSVQVYVSDPDAIVKATLAWADPPGTPAAPTLDPPDLMLVNDLDLRLTRGPSSWLPWVLNPANPAAPAGKSDNFRDNVEQVVAQVTNTGTYDIEVSHKGTLLDSNPQDYSLIISILPAPPEGATAVFDENFSGGMPAGWTVDTVRGVPWTINSPDPDLDNITGGSGNFAIVNNNFANTVTSLVTQTLDLSTATNAVLSFDSNFRFSDLESINVDTSTNGGGSWTNVWNKQGLLGFPTHYVLDLTNWIAGQANARLRFRYHSFNEPAGYFWQVDNAKLDAYFTGGPPPVSDPPSMASDPFPADGEVDAAVDSVLNWSAASGADTHDVHFGTSFPPALQLSQGGTGYDPGLLQYDTIYFWRVDEVNEAGTTSGIEWQFTTGSEPALALPGQAAGPTPVNGATNVGVNDPLSWSAGTDATSHDVYFGTDPTPAFIGNQGDTGYLPSTLQYSRTYHWRIDEVNDTGKTAGSAWSFTTEAMPPPPPTSIHLASINSLVTPGSRNRWTATVDVVVTDADDAPVSGILMEGAWSNGTNGGASCTTNGSGQCSVSKGNLKSNVASVVFTVVNLSGTDVVYQSTADTPDNPVTVFKDAPPANEAPTASPDTFETTLNAGFNGNVLDNDSKGQPEATVTGHDANTTSGVSLSVSANGDFSYTPPNEFVGMDTFKYTIANSEGSDIGQVTIEVSGDPGGALTLTATRRRARGTSFVDLAWSNGSGTVEITRNGILINSSAESSGMHSDNLGKKPSGDYNYEVCEVSTSNCASDSVSF